MTTVEGTGGKIAVVQVLRGLAAITVMCYHFKGILAPEDPFFTEINFLFNAGPAGVDLFFVISGFIMVYITQSAKGGLPYAARFLSKRLIRIWPVYAGVSIFYYLVIYRFNLVPSEAGRLMESLLFLPHSNSEPPFYGYAFLPVGWSLNYEVYFYLLLTLSLVAGRWRWILFYFFILTTLIVLPFAQSGGITFKADAEPLFASSYLNLLSNPIIWNFVYGTLIGFAYSKREVFLNKIKWLASPSATFLGVLLAVWQILSGFYGGHGPFQWGMGAAALFFFLILSDYVANKRFPQWMIYLGDISYSIYLWHLPVLASVTFFFDRVVGFPIFKEGIAAFLLSVGLTLWVSHESYLLLEKKLGRVIEQRLLRRR